MCSVGVDIPLDHNAIVSHRTPTQAPACLKLSTPVIKCARGVVHDLFMIFSLAREAFRQLASWLIHIAMRIAHRSPIADLSISHGHSGSILCHPGSQIGPQASTLRKVSWSAGVGSAAVTLMHTGNPTEVSTWVAATPPGTTVSTAVVTPRGCKPGHNHGDSRFRPVWLQPPVFWCAVLSCFGFDPPVIPGL